MRNALIAVATWCSVAVWCSVGLSDIALQAPAPVTLHGAWGFNPETDTLIDGKVRNTRVRWKKDRLVVERQLAGTARTRETCWLDAEHGRLFVDLEVSPEGVPRPISLRRAHEPQSGTR